MNYVLFIHFKNRILAERLVYPSAVCLYSHSDSYIRNRLQWIHMHVFSLDVWPRSPVPMLVFPFWDSGKDREYLCLPSHLGLWTRLSVHMLIFQLGFWKRSTKHMFHFLQAFWIKSPVPMLLFPLGFWIRSLVPTLVSPLGFWTRLPVHILVFQLGLWTRSTVLMLVVTLVFCIRSPRSG